MFENPNATLLKKLIDISKVFLDFNVCFSPANFKPSLLFLMSVMFPKALPKYKKKSKSNIIQTEIDDIKLILQIVFRKMIC